MNKKHLEIMLAQLTSSPKPRLRWEGYNLDPVSAAQMIYVAENMNRDISGKSVIDLGCGSGILAIGASLAEADFAVGVDIDKAAVLTARANAQKSGAQVELVVGDIACICGSFDTTLMNPPFGSWNRGADVQFLAKALEVSKVIYSLHKRSESIRDFLKQKITQLGGYIDRVYEMEIVIPKTYEFHRKRRYPVKVDFYRIIKR